jgi:predicted phage terminase large subunit-like protein
LPKIAAQPGPQEAFLSSPADIAIYGGAAGGGKSFALLLEPLRHIAVKGFSAVVFRRTLADVKKAGSLLDTSMGIYGAIGAKPRLDTLEWKFPKGAKVAFGHLEHETTVLDWQGAQVPLICFDELTHFTRKQFFYLLSRNRSTCGVRPYVRATTNPDADSWVADLIAWWIDQNTGLAIPERAGVVRWFIRVSDQMIWAGSRDELLKKYPECEPKSLTFIPARLEDNAILMAADPGYRSNLLALDRVERERLLGGNWKIRPSAGLYFQRHWCQIVDVVPNGTRLVRGWDLAATPKTQTNDPDATSGTKVGRCPDGRFIVAHHMTMHEGPLGVERAVLNTASADGKDVRIRIPKDPAQAGKAQADAYVRLLAGFDVRAVPISGDKIVRFSPFSAQAEAGNVIVLRGTWNEQWFSALESFPPVEGKGHDDDADSTAEAFNELTAPHNTGMLDHYRAQAEALKAKNATKGT